jgi:hypothetical protein
MLKEIIIVILVSFSLLGLNPQRTDAEPQIILTFEQHIERIFGEDAKVATAVLKHESRLKLDAKGYNCFYYREDGTRYSTSCKKEDRPKAWSVDCGIGQINIRGLVCPNDLMTLEGAMKIVEQKYKKEGLNAWVSYKTGRYKKFL